MILFIRGKDWQKLLQDYRIARHGTEQVSNRVADYYDSVMAICQCYEEFGITSENYKEFIGDQEVIDWFYNSKQLKGIQSAYRWQEGQKVTVLSVFRV